MTLADAAWQELGEDQPVLLTTEIATREKGNQRSQNHGKKEGGRKRREDVVCSCSFNKDLWGNVV